MARPMTGRIHCHFSLGSFLPTQGRSTSPFFILLEWKYLGGPGLCRAVDDAIADCNCEAYGEAKGLVAGAMESVSGVADRIVEVMVCDSMAESFCGRIEEEV